MNEYYKNARIEVISAVKELVDIIDLGNDEDIDIYNPSVLDIPLGLLISAKGNMAAGQFSRDLHWNKQDTKELHEKTEELTKDSEELSMLLVGALRVLAKNKVKYKVPERIYKKYLKCLDIDMA